MGGQLQRILVASLFLVEPGQTPSIAVPTFQFSCDTGYKQADCTEQVNQLGGMGTHLRDAGGRRCAHMCADD